MRSVPVLVLLLPAFAGCVAIPDAAQEDLDATTDAAWPLAEIAVHDELTFNVLSRTGGSVDIAGYAWWPDDGGDTVLLAIHGNGGNALRLWGPADNISGYSVAHRIKASDRAVVAIDLPGFGRSEATGEAAGTVDDYLHVTAQVAEQLRSGSYASDPSLAHSFQTVVGIGWSLGGFIVVQTEGHFSAFDAIVPTGWSDRPFSDAARACIASVGPCPTEEELLFEPDQVDPRIVSHFGNNTRDTASPALMPSVLPWTRPAEGIPALQDIGQKQVTVPVLWFLGDDDFYNRAPTQNEAEASFAASDDVTFVRFENTRHALLHHVNHEDVYASLLSWLEERGW